MLLINRCRYKKYQRGSVLSYAQLLFDCILNSRWKFNIDILRDELLNLYEVELRGRRLCRDFGVTKKQRLQLENFEPGQELECSKVSSQSPIEQLHERAAVDERSWLLRQNAHI